MLLIRDEQMKAFRAAERRQLRARLLFQLDAPAAELAWRVAQIDIGLAEAERLRLDRADDVALFLDTIRTRLGGFPVDGAGKVTYPAPLARLLDTLSVPAGERVRRCAEWLAVRERADVR